MTLLLQELVNGKVVSPKASEEMLALLAAQQISDRLPAWLPEGTRVAHKTGNLEGLVHDVGVVYAPTGPVVVVVLTEGLGEDQANEFIAKVGRLTYEAFSE